MIHRFGRSVAIAALMSIVAASPSFAQRDGGQRDGDGPGRGDRGRGGMFGARMGGGDMMLLGLLRAEEVQKEIKLMPDQIEALQKVGQEIRGERPDFDFRNASEAERREFGQKMQQRNEEASKKVREQLEQVLLPEQHDRLRQIALQQQGVGALSDPEVAKKLELTEEQKEKLMEIQRSSREKMIASIREASENRDREAMGKMMAESRKATLAEAREVLTSEQRKSFDEMLGKPFDLPAGAMGGFRGGRGGDGDRPRGEGRPERRGGGDRGDN